MKYSIVILLFAVCNVSQAQKNVLTTDTTIAIPRLDFDAKWKFGDRGIPPRIQVLADVADLRR